MGANAPTVLPVAAAGSTEIAASTCRVALPLWICTMVTVGSRPLSGTSVLAVGGLSYVEWAAVMRVRLQVRHTWEAVRYGDVDYYEDRRALDALIATASPEMQFSLS
jgi:hypothetical protein